MELENEQRQKALIDCVRTHLCRKRNNEMDTQGNDCSTGNVSLRRDSWNLSAKLY